MARAYCPECGTDVPVDDQGRCHIGHVVNPASGTGDDVSASPLETVDRTLGDVEPLDDDEPVPWVMTVDSGVDEVAAEAPEAPAAAFEPEEPAEASPAVRPASMDTGAVDLGGLEDAIADLGGERTPGGDELADLGDLSDLEGLDELGDLEGLDGLEGLEDLLDAPPTAAGDEPIPIRPDVPPSPTAPAAPLNPGNFTAHGPGRGAPTAEGGGEGLLERLKKIFRR